MAKKVTQDAIRLAIAKRNADQRLTKIKQSAKKCPHCVKGKIGGKTCIACQGR